MNRNMRLPQLYLKNKTMNISDKIKGEESSILEFKGDFTRKCIETAPVEFLKNGKKQIIPKLNF